MYETPTLVPDIENEPASPADIQNEPIKQWWPDVCTETRQLAIDLIHGDKPSTVLGLLIQRNSALTLEAIAGLLGKSIAEVIWTIEVLETEKLCARIRENGLLKARAFAPYQIEPLD
jgi:hypothetical protein